MKQLLPIVFLFASLLSLAQTGDLSGVILDKDYQDQPLPFADVYLKGTTTGASTDMDGKFLIQNIKVGQKIIIISFIGYETKEITVLIEEEKTTVLNEVLGAGQTLEGVVVQASTQVKESEKALLIEQKKSETIKESIGAVQLSKAGVTDASGATQKIAGVVKSESSSQVYIRGLGDRYLTTTLNGLPVPSDDIENKNINLILFNTSVIQNVGISKTFSASNYADQASGNVDVITKKYQKDFFKVGLNYGFNTNILGEDFRVTSNNTNNTLGFFSDDDVNNTISNGKWNPKNGSTIGNYGILLSGAKKINLFDNPLKLTASLSHSSRSNYTQGQFREFQNNSFKRDFNDVEQYSISNNTTALFDLDYKINTYNKISFNTLFVNKTDDILYEQGRSGLGRVLDQNDEDNDFGSFTRDQNIRQTFFTVNQFHGKHKLTENNELKWSAGYNYVNAQEPSRIRNEVNILSQGIDILTDSGFEQRKSDQVIEDNEYNFLIEDKIILANLDPEDSKFKLKIGGNYRKKTRDFRSEFFGLQKIGRDRILTESIDNLASILSPNNIGTDFNVLTQIPNTYNGELSIYAGYADFSFGYEKLTGNVGLRFELDEIDLNWDVTNFEGRIGDTSRSYKNYLPSVNIKYELNERHFLRFASSITTTLPEFKEIAPFVYISPTGRGTIGNEELDKSDNYNLDLKYEFFPTSGQLLSLAGFYKQINNPINKTLIKGSTGFFTYSNTGDEAKVFGLELEGKIDVLDLENSKLNVGVNFTKMWTEQDLKEEFQYNGNTTSELEGASDLIFNSSISFATKSDNQFVSTLTTNYSSDRITVLGASDNILTQGNLFNNEIIEKGFWTVDFVLSKQLFEKLKITATAKNLLNPNINQRQRVVTNFSGPGGDNRLVGNYKKGRRLALGVAYTF